MKSVNPKLFSKVTTEIVEKIIKTLIVPEVRIDGQQSKTFVGKLFELCSFKICGLIKKL